MQSSRLNDLAQASESRSGFAELILIGTVQIAGIIGGIS